MIDQTHIDLLTLIPTEMKRVASTAGGEYHGPCPFCGGRDRFVAQPKNGRWFCRRCESNGDAIALVMKLHNKSFTEALDALHIEYQQTNLPTYQKPNQQPITVSSQNDAPALTNEHWQERAQAYLQWCWHNLDTAPDAASARKYLHKRGIPPEVYGLFGVGYNPVYMKDIWGGKTVHLLPGIVFGWEDSPLGRVMKINTRLKNPSRDKKYMQVAGGANWLWGGYQITPGSTVVLVEGEIDALSVTAACGLKDGIVAVATWSVAGARLTRWVARLHMAKRVLIAFDDDNAGQQAAKWWRDVIPRAKRAIPTKHDLNEMLRYGDDIRGWINQHIGETS